MHSDAEDSAEAATLEASNGLLESGVEEIVSGVAKSSETGSGGAGSSCGESAGGDARRRRPRPAAGTVVKAKRKELVVVHDDLIGDSFWEENRDIFPLDAP